MKKIFFLMATVCMTYLLHSCKEEFDFNQITKGLERLVVEGYVTDTDSIHTIMISLSSDFISPQPAIPVTGAIVTVTDGTNHFSFSESEPGIYKNVQYFNGEIGKTYSLSVSYKNETYSAQSKLNPCFDIDIAAVVWEDSINYVFLSGQEPSAPGQFYILKTIVNGILNDTLANWSYFSDELINGIYFNYELFAMLEGKDTDTIGIRLQSVSKEFFTYFTSIVLNIGYEPDPFFSTTPANFKGNISNGGLGFFLASSVKEKKCERF